jgi:hypothetical protein
MAESMVDGLQGEFDFSGRRADDAREPDGLASWRESWRRQREDYARHIGLPLNHEVSITLKNGVDLRGTLALEIEQLLPDEADRGAVRLRIGTVKFLASDILACARM